MDVSIPGKLPKALRRLEDRNTRYVWVRHNAYVELLHSKRSSALCITAMDAEGEPLAGSHVVLPNREGEDDEVPKYLLSTWPDLDRLVVRRVARRICRPW